MTTSIQRGVILALVFGLAACSGAANLDHASHASHSHAHAGDCGHQTAMHEGHTDYLHDGHMHHAHEGHVDEHVVQVTDANPSAEQPADMAKHDGHIHTAGDTLHALIPHGDHSDYLHDGHLHHVHNDHVDEHGAL